MPMLVFFLSRGLVKRDGKGLYESLSLKCIVLSSGVVISTFGIETGKSAAFSFVPSDQYRSSFSLNQYSVDWSLLVHSLANWPDGEPVLSISTKPFETSCVTIGGRSFSVKVPTIPSESLDLVEANTKE